MILSTSIVVNVSETSVNQNSTLLNQVCGFVNERLKFLSNPNLDIKKFLVFCLNFVVTLVLMFAFSLPILQLM